MAVDRFSGIERRRFKRLNKAFVVRIQESIYSNWDVVLIHNISRGGLLLRIDSDLKVDMLLNLKINIALNREAISCFGKVVHARSLGLDTKFCEAGILFTQINEDDADLINRTVEELLSKEPRK